MWVTATVRSRLSTAWYQPKGTNTVSPFEGFGGRCWGLGGRFGGCVGGAAGLSAVVAGLSAVVAGLSAVVAGLSGACPGVPRRGRAEVAPSRGGGPLAVGPRRTRARARTGRLDYCERPRRRPVRPLGAREDAGEPRHRLAPQAGLPRQHELRGWRRFGVREQEGSAVQWFWGFPGFGAVALGFGELGLLQTDSGADEGAWD